MIWIRRDFGSAIVASKKLLSVRRCLTLLRGRFVRFYFARCRCAARDAKVIALIQRRPAFVAWLAGRRDRFGVDDLRDVVVRRLRVVDLLRECLDDLRSLLEASLDFDQNDTGHVPEEELEALFQRALEKLHAATLWESTRDAGADLQRVVLAGAPNAGKSSLYNALMSSAPDSMPALVDPLAGSTRDVRRGELSLGTGRVTLIDTAGVGPLQDPGETALSGTPDARAQERARKEVQAADLVLWVLDGGGEVPKGLDPPGLLVWNQIDRTGVSQEPPGGLIRGARGWCAVSAQEGQGLESLRKIAAELLGLAPLAGRAGPRPSEGEALGRQLRARHLDALRSARQALAESHQLKAQAAPLDLVAEALRGVSRELDAIEGSSTSEDLLDRIFSRFCLGK